MELKILKENLDKLGVEIVAETVKLLLEYDKKATGDLINSISYEILESSNGLMLNILASDYFKFVDEGRRPGGKMPPVDKIESWVRNKRITFSKNGIDFKPKQIAFVIASSIQKKGIKPTNIKQKVIQNILKNKELINTGLKIDIKDYLKKEIYK